MFSKYGKIVRFYFFFSYYCPAQLQTVNTHTHTHTHTHTTEANIIKVFLKNPTQTSEWIKVFTLGHLLFTHCYSNITCIHYCKTNIAGENDEHTIEVKNVLVLMRFCVWDASHHSKAVDVDLHSQLSILQVFFWEVCESSPDRSSLSHGGRLAWGFAGVSTKRANPKSPQLGLQVVP